MRKTQLIIPLLLFVAAGLMAGQRGVRRAVNPIASEYLVHLNPIERGRIPAVAEDVAQRYGGHLISVWSNAVQGFWISMPPQRADAMAHDPRIDFVEENQQAFLSGNRYVGGPDPYWNLDRIDARSGLDGSYHYCGTGNGVVAYIVDVGVWANHPEISGRVGIGHNFAPGDPPPVPGSPPPALDVPPYADYGSFNATNPCGSHNRVGYGGHGTAVATILGGTNLGVASQVTIVPLRIINCSGQMNGSASSGSMVDAYEWIVSADNGNYDATNHRMRSPSIVNQSSFTPLGSASDPRTNLEIAVQKVIDAGVTVFVSANNQDAQDRGTAQSPTRLSYSNTNLPYSSSEHVIAVGGMMRSGSGTDIRWRCIDGPDPSVCVANGGHSEPGSNYGLGVDFWAPADNIQGGHITQLSPDTGDPWNGAQYRRPYYFSNVDQTYSNMLARSGTSFASPLAAGVGARLLSEDSTLYDINHPELTADKIYARLRDSATRLDASAANLGTGSTNLLLYAGGTSILTQPASATIGTGDSATLTISVAGGSPSYQLYQGTTGNTSSPVGAPQTSGSFTVAPSSTTTYWIRATATCTVDNSQVNSDSATATVTVLATPSLDAHATSTSSVSLTWTSAGADATSYDVFRSTSGSPFGSTPYASGVTGLSYNDTGLSSQSGFAYKVRARHNGDAGTSHNSNVDYATTCSFTDSTVVKAIQIIELRTAVNAIAGAVGLPAQYTAAELLESSLKLDGNGQPRAVFAIDFTDVMTRMNQVRNTSAYGNLSVLSFRSPAPAGYVVISTNHLEDLRNAVK